MDGVVQHQRHSYIDSIDVLDLPRGRLCLHGSLESQNNHCRNVAHAALSRPYCFSLLFVMKFGHIQKVIIP